MVNAALKPSCQAGRRGRLRCAPAQSRRKRRRPELIAPEAEASAEPKPRRRFGWVLALLLPAAAAAIAANALLLQEARHPGPFFATRPAPEWEARPYAGRLALPNPRPHLRGGAEPAAAIDGDPVVFTVQQALGRAGYGPLSPDGLHGPQTGDAIRRFQLDEGLAVTGQIDEALIGRLGAIGAMDGD
jgi:hypothetical protein